MPADDTLPPSRLPANLTQDDAVRHFQAAFGIRVGANELDALPENIRRRLASARPPEPPEAVLLDRILQLVPQELLTPIKRILVLPTRGTGRLGGYQNGVVILSASEANPRRLDPDFRGRYSTFSTTVLHEIGHAVFQDVLAKPRQDFVLDDYLDRLDLREGPSAEIPTAQGAEHHFIALFLPAVLRQGSVLYGLTEARQAMARYGLLHRFPR